ncbi:MauE/DoxX family redox-associated membrane protein [Streptomyces syringium]|uniref:MauE/DoxX family redox-associated membrane protein n=1 Tax=Streptomyces syringium TaxID=76729 RepID=UPI00364DDE13
MSTLMACAAIASRAAIGTVFLLAAAAKAGRHRQADFRTAVTGLVPRARGVTATGIAAAVTLTECAVALLLALPGRAAATAGFTLAAIALTAFTTAIAAAIRRGTTTPCRCFSTSDRPLSGTQLTRNSILLGITLTGLAASLAADAASAQAALLWVAGGAGVLLGAALAVFDDLADLLAGPTTTRTAALTQERPR